MHWIYYFNLCALHWSHLHTNTNLEHRIAGFKVMIVDFFTLVSFGERSIRRIGHSMNFLLGQFTFL